MTHFCSLPQDFN
uniref:Uncharacterized protein n=1 Tax=Arundo donax TaxID=35708 RepID=A0A0A8YN06_ARUDO